MHGWLVRVDFAQGTFEAQTGTSAARRTADDRECVVVADRAAAELANDLLLRTASPNGVAAAGLWDRQTNALELARDRTGLHPLFYPRVEETVIAATDLRALVTAVSARPSPT